MQTGANEFYERFRQAANSRERKAITQEFHAFYATLTPEQKKQVRPVLDKILADADQIVAKMEPFAQRAELLLSGRMELREEKT